MDQVIIDNCVVSRFMGNGVNICPIRLAKKKHPTFEAGLLPRLTFGNRVEDNRVLRELSDGTLNFDDLPGVREGVVV